MAAAEAAPKPKDRSFAAIIGWGGLALFSVVFVWLISQQLVDTYSKREEDAKKVVREFVPPGETMNLQDITKAFSINAKNKGRYVGEFSWDAKQKDGPEYEVTLLWKEENEHRVAIWRVNLETKQVRPQGTEANALPERAKAGGV